MEQVMLSLISYIKEAMPELLLVDEDYGQLDMIDSEQNDTYPLTMPAVLINADNVEWANVARLNQLGAATLKVNLIIDCYDDHHYGSTTESKIADRQAMVRKLTKALQGHTLADGSCLIRTNSQFVTASHGIKVYSITFSFELYEDFEPSTVTKTVTPAVTVTKI